MLKLYMRLPGVSTAAFVDWDLDVIFLYINHISLHCNRAETMHWQSCAKMDYFVDGNLKFSESELVIRCCSSTFSLV